MDGAIGRRNVITLERQDDVFWRASVGPQGSRLGLAAEGETYRAAVAALLVHCRRVAWPWDEAWRPTEVFASNNEVRVRRLTHRWMAEIGPHWNRPCEFGQSPDEAVTNLMAECDRHGWSMDGGWRPDRQS